MRAVWVVAFAMAVAPEVLSQPVASSQNFRVAGRLIDSATSQPVTGALLHLVPSPGSTRSPGPTITVLSGTNGSFEFPSLAAGKYRLSAQHRGYLSTFYLHHGTYLTAIVTGPDQDTEHVVFPLDRAAEIRGTITDDFGDAVQGANLMLFRWSTDSGKDEITLLTGTSTNDLGEYRFTGLTKGRYYVVVQARPWYASSVSRTLRINSRNSSGSVETVEKPNPGYNAQFDVAFPLTFYPSATDEEGAQPIDLERGAEFRADLTLRVVPAAHLQIARGEGQSSIFQTPRISKGIFGHQILMGLSATGGDSYTEINGMAPGQYRISLASPNGTGMYRAMTLSGDTEMAAGPELAQPRIKGKVILTVPQQSARSIQFLNELTGERTAVNPTVNGTFEQTLSPGVYQVSAVGPGAVLHSMTVNGRMAPKHEITIEPGESVELSAVIAVGAGDIQGFAMRNGAPAPATMVLLVPDHSDDPALFRRDQSDTDGSFALRNVVPGDYTLLAISEGWDLEWARRGVLDRYLPQGKHLQINSGGIQKVQIEEQQK